MTPLSRLLKFQKDLNVRSTLSERRLVGKLRHAGIRPIWPQAIIGPFIVDILIPRKMLVVEVDGLIHTEPAIRAKDIRRTAYLSKLGFSVLRVPNRKVKHAETLKLILSYPDLVSRKRVKQALDQLAEQRNLSSGPLSVGPEF